MKTDSNELLVTRQAYMSITSGLANLVECSKWMNASEMDEQLVQKMKALTKSVALIKVEILEHLEAEQSKQSMRDLADPPLSYIQWVNYLNSFPYFQVSTRTIHVVASNLALVKNIKGFLKLTKNDVLSWRGAGKAVAKEIEAIQDEIRKRA